ncbi:MAG: MFS transporter [Acidobacteriota bacterium]|nr:MFS transporter [Acidobacteriota bacterium]
MTEGPASSRSIWSWALFQGGRDPYVILITIYVFVPYLVTSVIGDPVRGQALVAAGAKYGGWLVMLTAPLLGATVDRLGRRKPWLAGVVAMMVPLIALLWFAMPSGGGLSVTVVIALLAILGTLFAYTETLHNALLIPAAGMKRAGEASGLALALGNFVSVTLLAFTLWAFALPGKVKWSFVPRRALFGLNPATHQTDRIVGPIVAVLLALLTIPLLRNVPDVAATGLKFSQAVRLAVGDLRNLFVKARGHRDALIYLGARMLFTDGLTGILIFIGVYAAGTMGWQTIQLLAYGLILSSCSVLGGLLAGQLDSRSGPKKALTIEIVGVIISQLLLLGNTKTSFLYQPYDPAAHAPLWHGPMFTTAPEIGLILASMLGAITVTAAYSSSRTMLTRVAPADRIGIFFGLFVIAGSATMWLGPLLVQLATTASGSQRIGLLPLSVLLFTGLAILQLVRIPTRAIEDFKTTG